jgi:uncharacterized protein
VSLLPASAALYPCAIAHARTGSVRHAFRLRTYTWLVDVDELPRLPWPLSLLARFDVRDHLGHAEESLRGNVERLLAAQGIVLDGGRIVMVAQARVLGHVFDPLSVFWCYDKAAALACVVAEVHNTYGERHAYVLHTDVEGLAEVPKAFYVSPFYPVDGSYRLRLPEPDDRLRLSIRLDRGDGNPFVATVMGRRVAATLPALLRLAVRHPVAPLLSAVRIRRHGVQLWLRGLRVVRRPVHSTQEGLS